MIDIINGGAGLIGLIVGLLLNMGMVIGVGWYALRDMKRLEDAMNARFDTINTRFDIIEKQIRSLAKEDHHQGERISRLEAHQDIPPEKR